MIFFTKKDTPINSFQEARLSDRKDDNKINRTVKNVEKFIRIGKNNSKNGANEERLSKTRKMETNYKNENRFTKIFKLLERLLQQNTQVNRN